MRGNGSGFLPDRDGKTELISPASLVRVDTARRNVEVMLPFIMESKEYPTLIHDLPISLRSIAHFISVHPTDVSGRLPRVDKRDIAKTEV